MFKIKQVSALFLFFALWGCSPIPGYFKKGDAYYQQMDYELSATYYYNILLLDATNSTAKEALTKTANLVLTNKFSRFGNLVAQNRTEEALQQYQINQRYFEKVKAVQVNLNWPSMYEGLFEEVKYDYIKQKTDEIAEKLGQNKYEQVEVIIEQIALVEPIFRNATILRQELLLNAYLNYAQKLAKNQKNYKAIVILKKATGFLKSNEKSALLLLELSNKIKQKLAYFPIEEQVKTENFASVFELNFLKQFNKIQPDLIEVVAGNQLKKLLPDSIRNTNEPNLISKSLQLAGVNLYLQIAVNEYKTTMLYPKNADSIVGYEAYIQKLPAKEEAFPVSVYRFKPVKYAYLKKLNKIESRITYRLVDCASQLTITENSISLSVADSLESYFYKGDLNMLYKEKPVSNQLPARNAEFYAQFNLVQSDLIPMPELASKLQQNFIDKCLEDIQIYLKQD